MTYFWQTEDWPHFTYEIDDSCARDLDEFMLQVGRVGGLVDGLMGRDQLATRIQVMVAEAMTTSEIEGEFLSRTDVISSVRNNLGLNQPPVNVGDQRAMGAAALTVAVRHDYPAPLSEDILFEWHSKLLGWDRSINAGAWRSHGEPMQVVSGPVGRETVHFEAPPSDRVATEMRLFIDWFNATAPGQIHEIGKSPIRAALAHLHFETIHPFEDGNGRMGRALSEKALSQGLGSPLLMSLSATIATNKRAYYDELMTAQRRRDVSGWISFFSRVCVQAQETVNRQVKFTLQETQLFNQFENRMNPRQIRVVRRMFKAGPDGFIGGMNARKYMAIAKTSKATATRDLQGLRAMGVFRRIEGGGRNTRYALAAINSI